MFLGRKANYTIVIPVFQGMPTAEKSIKSVLRQSYKDFELVVIDNGGCTQLQNFICSLSDERVTIVTYSTAVSIEENWQRIHELNLSEYMTVIGHDDELNEGYLATIEGLISKYPNCSIYGTPGDFVDENRNFVSKVRHLSGRIDLEDYLGARFGATIDVSGTGFVYRSSDFKALGGFPKFERLFFADDVFWLKLLSTGSGIILGESSYKVMIHSKSMSFTQPSIGINLSAALVQFDNFYKREIAEDIREFWIRRKTRFMKSYLLRAGILVCLDDLSKPLESPKFNQFLAHCTEIIKREDFKFYFKLIVTTLVLKLCALFFKPNQILAVLQSAKDFIKKA